MSQACLVDTTQCIGCRGCQIACKQWNELEAEKTEFFAGQGGYQNPPVLSSKTFSSVGRLSSKSNVPGPSPWNLPAC